DVAQEEDPEAIGNDDPLWRWTGFAGAWQRLLRDSINGNGDAHRTASARRPRSIRAISSAEISSSSLLRNAKARNATNAPSRPTPAIHQMCQISAKPVTTAKKALTKPIALFLGISIGTYAGACPV